MRRIAVIAALAVFTVGLAFAKDHADQYQAGTFSSTGRLNDGSYANCSGGGCSAYSAGHNIHYIVTNDGIYSIEAPVSVAGTMLLSMGTNGNSPTMHKAWFMDQLHEGDKILFAAKCGKHNRCEFWLPNPDKVGKEVATLGSFEPTIAKTNTAALCGTGKLVASVEAQVCNQPPVGPAQEPPPPSLEDQAKQAQQYADCLKVAVNNPSIVCKQ
jgi:hypothetical protein